eukprot:1762351-Pyramimonas_sp.AAC.1
MAGLAHPRPRAGHACGGPACLATEGPKAGKTSGPVRIGISPRPATPCASIDERVPLLAK